MSVKMPMFHILLNINYDRKKSASSKMDTAGMLIILENNWFEVQMLR